MPALVNAMLEVLVEFAILAFVSYFYWSVNGSRPLQRRFILYCINTCSISITKGVKLVNLGLQSERFFFLSKVCLTPCVSFFLSRLWLVPLSLFLLVVTSLVLRRPLRSYTSGLYEVILLLFSADIWWLRRRNLLVAVLLGRSSRWLDLLVHPPVATLCWSALRIASTILPLTSICWEDAQLASYVVVRQWNDEQSLC